MLFNTGYLLWNWLEYSHARDVHAMNQVDSSQAIMPGAQLLLLKERAVAQQPAAPQVSNAVVPDATAAGGSIQPQVTTDQAQALCLLLGPFADQAAGKVLLDRLVALDIHGKFAAIEISGEPDYWVYLRPEATRELAITRLHELQEKKIDSFIVPQGDVANAISLGVFDKQENAEKRQKSIAEMGYDAQIRINPRVYMENWVVIYPEESPKFSQELYMQLHGENNKIDLRKEQCVKVASAIDIH
jgi:hypothetical protein